MLEEVKKACSILGYNVEDFRGLKDANDKVVPSLLITCANLKLVVVGSGATVDLVAQLDLLPEDTELLAKQHAETQGRLFTILKREMMEGRTGFVLGADDKGLHWVRLTQRLIVSSTDINSVQRLGDAIQEIAVVASRCSEVLGQTFGSLKTSNADYNKTYSSIMYS